MMLELLRNPSLNMATKFSISKEVSCMNVIEYIEELMEQGYSEEDASTAAAYLFTDYHGEED